MLRWLRCVSGLHLLLSFTTCLFSFYITAFSRRWCSWYASDCLECLLPVPGKRGGEYKEFLACIFFTFMFSLFCLLHFHILMLLVLASWGLECLSCVWKVLRWRQWVSDVYSFLVLLYCPLLSITHRGFISFCSSIHLLGSTMLLRNTCYLLPLLGKRPSTTYSEFSTR